MSTIDRASQSLPSQCPRQGTRTSFAPSARAAVTPSSSRNRLRSPTRVRELAYQSPTPDTELQRLLHHDRDTPAAPGGTHDCRRHTADTTVPPSLHHHPMHRTSLHTCSFTFAPFSLTGSFLLTSLASLASLTSLASPISLARRYRCHHGAPRQHHQGVAAHKVRQRQGPQWQEDRPARLRVHRQGHSRRRSRRRPCPDTGDVSIVLIVPASRERGEPTYTRAH